VLAREEGAVRIYGVNDGAEWRGELRYGLCALTGGYPKSEEIEVTLAANASTLLAAFDAAEWTALGLESHLAFGVLSQAGKFVAQDRLILPLFREMRWPDSRIDVVWDGERARFSSTQFAWNVCLGLDDEHPWPDNFFDLLPGVAREFAWPRAWGEPRVLRIGNLSGR
jgi:hypothetical protein